MADKDTEQRQREQQREQQRERQREQRQVGASATDERAVSERQEEAQRRHEEVLSGLPDPQEQPDGQSFYNPATVGSGTITEDGVYGAPLPDPTLVRGLGPDRTSGGRRAHASTFAEEVGPGVYRDPEQTPGSAQPERAASLEPGGQREQRSGAASSGKRSDQK